LKNDEQSVPSIGVKGALQLFQALPLVFERLVEIVSSREILRSGGVGVVEADLPRGGDGLELLE
jgi:hypothetical protein